MNKNKFINTHNTFELVCVDKENTGLKCDLYLLSSGKNKKNMSPKLYAYYNDEFIEFSINDIDPKPEEPTKLNNDLIDEVKKYIKTNYQLLFEHWNNNITDKDILNKLSN